MGSNKDEHLAEKIFLTLDLDLSFQLLYTTS